MPVPARPRPSWPTTMLVSVPRSGTGPTMKVVVLPALKSSACSSSTHLPVEPASPLRMMNTSLTVPAPRSFAVTVVTS